MKLSAFVYAVLLSAGAAAAADPFRGEVGCTVAAAAMNSVFSGFVGGKAVIDLRDGSTTLTNGSAVLRAITPATVSSHGAERGRCVFGTEVVWAGETLRAVLFKFNDCAHRDPASGFGGYVRADVGFDFARGTGKYREIFLTPAGPVPSAFADFTACERHVR